MTDSANYILFNPTESKDTRSGFGAALLELGTTHPEVVAFMRRFNWVFKNGQFQRCSPQ